MSQRNGRQSYPDSSHEAPFSYVSLDGEPYFEQHHTGDAGYDLKFVSDAEELIIPPQSTVRIHTGVKVAIPLGYFGLIKDRSSMALKGLECKGGVIDAGYRGELVCIAFNRSPHTPITVTKYERIAQLLVLPCAGGEPDHLEELPNTSRGTGGFGSTGK